MRLIADDLPEFERPTNAISRPSSFGKSFGLAALFKNVGLDTRSRGAEPHC
jgi:hypothetical protein